MYLDPLNKSEMVYCNVEAKIPYQNVLLAIITHHNFAHKLLLNKQNAFRNLSHVLLHSAHQE